MYQEFFAKSDLLVWPVLGLLIFVMIFVGVLAYVFLGLRDKDKIDHMASLPFDGEPEIESGSDVSADALTDGLMNGRTR
jgi:cbb3-type cytochrome oxidase subunit 3